MNCLDSSAVIDYLEGEEAIGKYLEERSNQPFFAPTVVLHEVFVGAARVDGAEGVRHVREDLDWIEPLPLTADAAGAAAVLDAELHDDGNAIGPMDTIIAGVVRDIGGTLITADDHFRSIPRLDVETYRD